MSKREPRCADCGAEVDGKRFSKAEFAKLVCGQDATCLSCVADYNRTRSLVQNPIVFANTLTGCLARALYLAKTEEVQVEEVDGVCRSIMKLFMVLKTVVETQPKIQPPVSFAALSANVEALSRELSTGSSKATREPASASALASAAASESAKPRLPMRLKPLREKVFADFKSGVVVNQSGGCTLCSNSNNGLIITATVAYERTAEYQTKEKAAKNSRKALSEGGVNVRIGEIETHFAKHVGQNEVERISNLMGPGFATAVGIICRDQIRKNTLAVRNANTIMVGEESESDHGEWSDDDDIYPVPVKPVHTEGSAAEPSVKPVVCADVAMNDAPTECAATNSHLRRTLESEEERTIRKSREKDARKRMGIYDVRSDTESDDDEGSSTTPATARIGTGSAEGTSLKPVTTQASNS